MTRPPTPARTSSIGCQARRSAHQADALPCRKTTRATGTIDEWDLFAASLHYVRCATGLQAANRELGSELQSKKRHGLTTVPPEAFWVLMTWYCRRFGRAHALRHLE